LGVGLLPVHLLVVAAHHVPSVRLVPQQLLDLLPSVLFCFLLVLLGLDLLAGALLGSLLHQLVVLALRLELQIQVLSDVYHNE